MISVKRVENPHIANFMFIDFSQSLKSTFRKTGTFAQIILVDIGLLL